MGDQTKIRILSEDLTNKIAAGEVVDRPASVIKELVENAIDAAATEITVIVKDGGKSLVHVVDNGTGMTEADLLMAFQRHATSKIATYEDLTHIHTMGFRGEALASIASVSHIEARTVEAGASSGYSVQIEGGVMSDVSPAAGPAGTSIAVKHLFYNTPARRKFLKATSTEYRRVLNVMNRFYLSYPETAFTFVNDDEVIHEFKSETSEERMGSVFGIRVQQNLLAIENDGPVRISGFVGNPDVARRSRGDQYLFFNRRYFVSKSLNYAVVSGYGEVLDRGLYPIYVVFIEMDTEQADVNVHPTKMEIKFANDPLMFSTVRGSVKRALASGNVVPELRPRGISQSSFDLGQPATRSFDFDYYKRAALSSDPAGLPLGHREQEQAPVESERARPAPLHSQPVFERTNVWQVHNKYIFSQLKNGLIVIDQHVAHERILYEKALADFEKRKPSSQQLLFPEIIELSAEDYSLMLEMLTFLEHAGFIVKAFGKNTLVLEGVPSGIKISNDQKVLLDILDEFKRGRNDTSDIRDNVAKSVACHTAIRAGESLNLDEMNLLIDQLFSTKEPYFCPHGRPVLIHIPMEELDRRFKR